MAMGGDKRRVLIVGAGVAGISAALELKKASARVPGLEVIVVDQRDYHSPLPFVWQVVSGGVDPRHISFPLNALLQKRGDPRPVRFRQSRVESIDVGKKVVSTDDGELHWDYLVMALGSTANFFGMSDAEENSLCLRSVEDAVNIHNHILDSCEAALQEVDEQRCRELLTFVVVGGGPTGIELAAAIQDFVGNVLVRDYPSLRPLARVLLIEAQDGLLSGFKPRLSELAVSRLGARGIDVLLKTRIAKVSSGGIQTADGETVPARTVVWAAGVKPVAVVESLPFNGAKDGRIMVNQYLEVPDSPGVYAVGDCAYLLQADSSVPYPPTHQVAARQGPVCARNIIRVIQGKEQLAFRYKFKGQVIYVGRNMVLAQVWDRVFDGFAAALVRRVYYLWVFVSYLGLPTEFRRKMGAVRDWISAYFHHGNAGRL
jgi:NADH dehydrogenase